MGIIVASSPTVSINMPAITIELPFPISANVYWRFRVQRVNGKYIPQPYVTPEAKKYKATVRDICVKAGIALTDKPVRLTVVCYMPSIDRDLMNSCKVLEDALEGGVYVNDNQIVRAEYIRHEANPPKNKNAKVIVTIEQVDYAG